MATITGEVQWKRRKVLEYTKPAEVIGDLGEIKKERLRMTSTADGKRQR